jgi:hypothetical protein
LPYIAFLGVILCPDDRLPLKGECDFYLATAVWL